MGVKVTPLVIWRRHLRDAELDRAHAWSNYADLWGRKADGQYMRDSFQNWLAKARHVALCERRVRREGKLEAEARKP